MIVDYGEFVQIKTKEDLKRIFQVWGLINPQVGVTNNKEKKLLYYFFLLTRKYKMKPIRITKWTNSYRHYAGHTHYLQFEVTHKKNHFFFTLTNGQTQIKFKRGEDSWYNSNMDSFEKNCHLLIVGNTKDFIRAMRKIKGLFLLWKGEKSKKFKLSSFGYSHKESRKMFDKLFRRYSNGKISDKKFINALTLVI